jgi:protein-tyrosine phosphatase
MQRQRNLRDLGGPPTRNGLVVAMRRLFRSSSPSHFDADEQRELVSLGLRCAIDLRTTAERVSCGPSALSAGVQVLHFPLFETPRINWISPADQTPRATSERYSEMLEDGLQAVAAVVKAIGAHDATPLLLSCSAGRDRTGIVVVCLLELLGVTDEAIAADYAKSDSFGQGGRAHATTAHLLLALIRQRFGSIRRMLAPQGISPEMIEGLRRDLVVRA